jgi:hypothetical protein
MAKYVVYVPQIIVGGHRPFYFNVEAFAKAFAKDTNGILHKL